MFEFFDNLQKKRAFKKALEEIDLEEASASREKHTKDTSIQRVYQTADSGVVQALPPQRVKNPLRKPETTAVDLKYFRDWRKVNKVASTNVAYPKTKKLFDDDDDGDEKQINSPVNFSKQTPEAITTTDMLNKLSAKPIDSEKDKKFETYFSSNISKQQPTQPSTQKTTQTDTQASSNNTNSKKSLRELVEIFAPGEIEKREKAKALEAQQKAQAVKPQENKIKVEVVDLTDKKPEPKPIAKKTVNRKPRGKSKRRFDADVISSVDWK